MTSKITVSSLLVLLVLINKVHELEGYPPVGNDVDKLLQKLRKIVDAALVKAQEILDKAKAKLNGIAQKTENAASQALQGFENKLKNELDALKQKAKNAGVNIDDCLGENERKLINLPNDFAVDMVQCVQNTLNEGINYAQDALNKIKKIVSDVENIKQEIKDCGHGWKSVKCLAKLAARIEREIVSLPTQIEKDATETALLISQLDKRIEKCASEKTDKWKKRGENLLKTIGICITSKIIT
ncbi:uncharacterized protein [Leptinotarsa decemlineata]|uniref:uncharacterized protein n=1 Tax=Leptinotarsa decemlineata TaxID=7539 RepID=UPI003D308E49